MTYCVNVFHLTTSLHLLMTASYVFQVASYPQAVLHTLTDTTAGWCQDNWFKITFLVAICRYTNQDSKNCGTDCMGKNIHINYNATNIFMSHLHWCKGINNSKSDISPFRSIPKDQNNFAGNWITCRNVLCLCTWC